VNINQKILGRLDESGECSYSDLTHHLGVSTMTVRRRVAELAKQGAVIKTPGGVRVAGTLSSLYETAIQSRIRKSLLEKRAIASAAANLINGDETVFIDGGTTCLEMAKKLADHSGLTVVTNSALMCLELGRGGKCRVIAIGGQYDAMSLSYGGPTAEDIAKRFFPDIAFFSTKGFIAEEGTFESSEPTLRIKQIVAAQCRRVALLVDHTKFGERGLCKVLDTAQIHQVVTDAGAPKAALEKLRSMNVETIVA
jgi:DeoR family transcriptional regulator of aga operon